MPGLRQELASAVLNGKLYVIGGYDENRGSTATVQVYNPTTDRWALAHLLPYAVNHNAAAVAGGRLYSFGAGGGETFVYNPNNNSWSARASSHYVHSDTAAVGVINDKIYIAGGTNTPSQRELEVYDPVANRWTVKAAMSVPRNHTAGGVINGQFYVVGGRAGPNPTAALEVYNPQTNTWSTRAPMPTARSGIAAAVVNNELWVFGGEELDALHAEVEVYNPDTNSWRRLPGMPLPRHGSWASVIGNKIYIPGGGALPGFAATNTNQIFTVSGAPIPTPTPTPAGRAAVADFNGDSHQDAVIRNATTHQTLIGYLDNNVVLGADFGPTLPGGWALSGVADFNRDSYPDYAPVGRKYESDGNWIFIRTNGHRSCYWTSSSRRLGIDGNG